MERNGRKGKIRKGHGSRILPAVSSRQDCELIELVSLSLSLCVIPFVFESSTSSKFSYRASRPFILVVYSFYSLVGIDRSIDRSKLCLFFLSFFFFFYTEIHSRPKVIDEFNDEWRGKRYPVNSFHHGSNR